MTTPSEHAKEAANRLSELGYIVDNANDGVLQARLNRVAEIIDAATSDLKKQLAEKDREIGELRGRWRKWLGCESCGEDHPESSMCPPHEVRTTGQTWFKATMRKAIERAEATEVERDRLKDEIEPLRMVVNRMITATITEVEAERDRLRERVAEGIEAMIREKEASVGIPDYNRACAIRDAIAAFRKAYSPQPASEEVK